MPDPVRLMVSAAGGRRRGGNGAAGGPPVSGSATKSRGHDRRDLGLAAGFYLGCWILKLRPHWPPREDLDRLLLVVLPVAMATESLAVLPRVPPG